MALDLDVLIWISVASAVGYTGLFIINRMNVCVVLFWKTMVSNVYYLK
ncbi:unnamed protein product [Brugia timori]|uniref:Nicotinamide riboside transporter PnuC n=1 Tax=Brugia timori TaxID=42155 RepID=A0A0R3QMD5_9BILA|nr:unnamed protein product [Brugia timori]